jgi:hypothetical protein
MQVQVKSNKIFTYNIKNFLYNKGDFIYNKRK